MKKIRIILFSFIIIWLVFLIAILYLNPKQLDNIYTICIFIYLITFFFIYGASVNQYIRTHYFDLFNDQIVKYYRSIFLFFINDERYNNYKDIKIIKIDVINLELKYSLRLNSSLKSEV